MKWYRYYSDWDDLTIPLNELSLRGVKPENIRINGMEIYYYHHTEIHLESI